MVETIIKKGEEIPNEIVKFFLDGKTVPSKYITAGADIEIKFIDDNTISIMFKDDIDPVLKSAILRGEHDFNNPDTECFVRINSSAMKNDGGVISTIPSIHFIGRRHINAQLTK